jgi:hypothetical protein
MHLFNKQLFIAATVIGWHWSDSITWRWILSVSGKRQNKMGPYYLSTYQGEGFIAGINMPFGSIMLQVQPNMFRKGMT